MTKLTYWCRHCDWYVIVELPELTPGTSIRVICGECQRQCVPA